MQGEVIYECFPFWLVVRRRDGKRRSAYDVVDTSVVPHQRVRGPFTDQDEAVESARLLRAAFLTLTGHYL